jgi:hypothetical protein
MADMDADVIVRMALDEGYACSCLDYTAEDAPLTAKLVALYLAEMVREAGQHDSTISLNEYDALLRVVDDARDAVTAIIDGYDWRADLERIEQMRGCCVTSDGQTAHTRLAAYIASLEADMDALVEAGSNVGGCVGNRAAHDALQAAIARVKG